jgi:hypothetical protein
MIFGGHGRVRGEVFFPCTRCSSLNAFALIENYGYGQLYGVRIAKYKTNRGLVCAYCRDGYPLTKEQWNDAKALGAELQRRADQPTLKEAAQAAVELALKIFPEMADDVRATLWEQLGEPKPIDSVSDSRAAAAEPLALESSTGELKSCPDCAEQIQKAARKCRFCGYLFDQTEPEP